MLVGCTPQSGNASPYGGSQKRTVVQSDELQFRSPSPGDPIVTIETNKGTLQAVIYPKYAPLAAENFARLSETNYYNGNSFHRVVPGFVVQGGAAKDTDKSFWGTSFPVETTDKLHHYAGALCMAASPGRTTANQSQFYIVAAPAGGLDDALQKLEDAGFRREVVDAYAKAGGLPYLDNTDTVFGQVYSGMDVVDKIAGVATDEDGRPRSEVTIVRITHGLYEAPPASTSAPRPTVKNE